MELENCVICKKEIKKKDDYFRVELFMYGKSNGVDFAHRICWLEQNKMNSNVKELMAGGLKLLRSIGVTKEKEVVVTI